MSPIRTLDRWPVQRFKSHRSGKFRVILIGKREDGETVDTSVLAEINGDTVTTYSGSRYRLGTPGLHVREHAKAVGVAFDAADPLAFLLTPEWAFEFKAVRS